MTTNTALGLDLGVKTGSLVQIRVDPEYHTVSGSRTLVSWVRGPSIKDPLEVITEFFDRYLLSWLHPVNVGIDQAVAVDWDRREVYWSANKSHSNIKTFIAGYIMRHCHENGVTPRFVTPADVRSFFGFSNSKVHKSEVQRHFLTNVPVLLSPESKFNGHHYETEHDLDALILAYIMAMKWRAEPCPLPFRVSQYQW